jgi:hypothetical protein
VKRTPLTSFLVDLIAVLPRLRWLAASTLCTCCTSGKFGAAGADRFLWLGEHLLA